MVNINVMLHFGKWLLKDQMSLHQSKESFFFSKPNREISDSTWYNSIPPHVEDERASDTQRRSKSY